ncbi:MULTISPECIES: FecR family protein [Methylosinus]|uniref:Iron dicitrate transport regulator FecR n=1 Tax=Methylosinus trichosporium (strain ATCC 35070 / NCIMB 11131 / UNIQEM 75 / OB3b) TaxID=595536 RepID=A0A2D2CVW4_METT3|nr:MULTISPECIES: FecR domain-containing protein [Methylosinus]ATQ66824.1 iron dicitrate transport regulator FecR [Methylosinus trichosporium OB3b]OBS50641.1 iron dicitrate transport regulator FecR [Methylosinus sp. 3S-1]
MSNGQKEPESDAAGDAAIEWFVRLREGPLAPDEKAELDAWLAEDAANAVAFDEVLSMYGDLAVMSPSRAERPRRRLPRIRVAALAGVAAAALALFASFDEIATRLRADHFAGAGERKLVTLDDGSRVLLDSRSAIALRYSPGERRLALLSGEAWFEVAPDVSRPFIVEAGGGAVTALGTAFDVALEGAGARVTVTEHRVSLSSGGRSVVVDEGRQSAFEPDAAARSPEPVNVDQVTAWRRGKLIVTKKPLRDVLAAIGRYHRGFVYCVERSICERRVSGVFGADDALQSLQEIETSLGLRAIHLTRYMILLY